ncbi:MAG: HAMP domain-containing sensor histidine kinase [Chloroherpetonaceae bacterium]|nr:HAMP domain-containing sensor histidine kinase [Chloroherpetonaceae bacterium]
MSYKSLSLSARIFLLVSILLFSSLFLIWFFVRPSYDASLVDERMTVISQQQRYAQETVDRQVSQWIEVSRFLGTLFNEQPVYFERALKQQIEMRSELALVRIISQTSRDELEGRNTSYPDLNLTISDSLWQKCPTDDLTEVAWVRTEVPILNPNITEVQPFDSTATTANSEVKTQTTAFLVFRRYSLFKNDTYTILTYFDATNIRRLLINLPIGDGTAVRIDGASKTLDSTETTAPFTSIPIRSKYAQVERVSSNLGHWRITSSGFETLPFAIRIAVPEDLILRPAHELMIYSLFVIGFLAAVVLLVGWLASRELTQPVKELQEDIEPLTKLEFDRPVRPSRLPELSAISETIESMRLSLDRYQQLNVDKIIFEEWKNRFLMTYSQDMIGICDSSGKFSFINTRLSEIFTQLKLDSDCTKDRLLAFTSASTSNEKRRRDTVSGYNIETVQVDISFRFDRTDNHFHYFSLQDISIRTSSGELWGSMIILRDQTTERELEQVKNETLGIIVHEIRSPLNGITGFADLLKMTDGLTEETKEYVDLISDSALRISKLVNRFLDVMRLESGSMILNRAPVSLEEIIHGLMLSLKGLAFQKNLRFNFVSEPSITPINASKDLMTEAIQNLMTNAIKYGGKDRTIDMNLSQTPTHLIFSITDYGYGIPKEFQDKLFTKFYRIQSENNKTEIGTGLGLAYVREIVTRHEGQITLESRPEFGSRFTIKLPIKKSSEFGKDSLSEFKPASL